MKFSLETAIADAKALKSVGISAPKCALVVSIFRKRSKLSDGMFL